MDAIFLVGIRSREQLAAVAAAVKIPVLLGGVPAELMSRELLAAHKVRVCLQGHLPIMAAMRAVHDTMKALRDGTPPAKISGVASPELVRQASRLLRELVVASAAPGHAHNRMR